MPVTGVAQDALGLPAAARGDLANLHDKVAHEAVRSFASLLDAVPHCVGCVCVQAAIGASKNEPKLFGVKVKHLLAGAGGASSLVRRPSIQATDSCSAVAALLAGAFAVHHYATKDDDDVYLVESKPRKDAREVANKVKDKVMG